MIETHSALSLPYEDFGEKHVVYDGTELLFFFGYAGENSHYWPDQLDSYGSGFCTQQKLGAVDNEYFEIPWDPQKACVVAGTSDQTRAEMRFENAQGFSGSLVFNTRFIETAAAGRVWSPKDAVVTGMVQRWAPESKTLLARRIEHIRPWLELTVLPTSIGTIPSNL
jgi:hypothetical protein